MIMTINKAGAYFKEKNPGTAISASAIRKGVLAGKIPHSKVGTRNLVDTDIIEMYFAGQLTPPQVAAPGTIRPVGRG